MAGLAPSGRGRVPSPSLVPSGSSPCPPGLLGDEGGIHALDGQGPAPGGRGWCGHHRSLLMSVPPSPSHLAQNPFVCDCHLKWLADYLQDNPIETSGARCSSPRRLANKRISQVKSKKFRCSGNQVRAAHLPSAPLEARNPIWRTASCSGSWEQLCKLNWGNSVSPAENQLPYGFKIKHTHTVKSWGGEGGGRGMRGFRRDGAQAAAYLRGQVEARGWDGLFIHFFLVSKACSPSGR